MADASTWDKWFAFEMKGKGIEDATKMLERLGKESEETANKVIANCQKIKAELDKGEKGDFGLAKSVELENEKLVQSLERQKAIFKSGEKWMSQNGAKIELKTSVDIDTTIAEAKMAQLAVDARKASEEVKASFDSESVTKWANDLIASGAPIQEVFDAIEAKMEDIRDEMDMLDYKFGSTDAYGGRASEAVAQDGQAYQALGEIIDKVKEQVIALQEQQFGKKGSATVIEDSAKGADEASKQVENLDERLQHASDTAKKVGSNVQHGVKQSVGSVFDGLIDLEREPEMLEEVDRRINRIKGDIAEMRENAQSGRSGFNVSELAESIAEAEKELKRYEKMRSALMGKQEEPKPQEKRPTDSKAFNDPAIKLPSMKQIAGGAVKLLEASLKGIASSALTATSALVSFTKNGVMAMGSALKSVASTAFHGIINGFNMLNNGARTAISTMASLGSRGFNAIKSGAQSAISGVRGLISKFKSLSGKTSQNLLKSFSSIKSMLKRRIKRTFISSIFNQAKEGIQQLAKYSSAFNSVMSSIKSSAKQASGNLAVAMGNIITMLAPAIQWLLNALSALFEKLNAIFALLTGKSTVTTAKKQTDNYAQSLDNAGGSAKDLNKQLYGFDELTRQDDNSGGGGGKIEYEESDIGGILGGLKDAFEQIKQAFENGEYERVGELIAEQLNKIVYKINDFLVDLRPKAVEWSKIIARILNGLVSKWDAKATGEMLANGLNLVLDTINTFFETFNFNALGTKLAEMVNGMFNRIEWTLVGKTIANYFNSFWRTLSGFVTSAKWKTYGIKFGVAVNSFFKNFDYKAIETSIVGGFNGIIDTMLKFIDTVRWDKFSKEIFASISRVINGIEWEKIGKLLSSMANTAFNVVQNFLAEDIIPDTFSGLGTTIGKALNGINWDNLATIVTTGLSQISKGFTEFVKNLDLPNLGTKLASGVQTMIDTIDWDARKEAITTGINSVLGGLENFVTGVDWAGFATDFATNTNAIIDAVNWDSLANTVSTGTNALITAFGELINSDMMVNLAENLGTTVNNVLCNIDFDKLGRDVRDGIGQMVRAFKALITRVNFTDIAKKVGDGLRQILTPDESGKTIFESIAESVRLGIGTVAEAFGTLIDTVLQSEVIDGQTVNLGTRLAEGFNNLFEDSGSENSLFSRIGTTIGSAISNIFKNILTFITTADIGNMAQGLFDMISSGVEQVFSGEDAGFNKGRASRFGESISKAIADVLTHATEFLEDVNFQEIGEAIGSMLGSIDWIDIGKKFLHLLWAGLTGALSLIGGVASAFFRKIFGIADPEVFDASATEWANQFADSTDEAFQSGEFKQRLARTATLVATDMGEDLLEANKDAEKIYSGYAEAVAISLQNAFNGVDTTNTRIGLMSALGLDSSDTELRNAMQKFLDDIRNFEGELSQEDILQGIYNNSESAEKLVAYFESLGLDAPQQLIDNLVGSKPRVDEASRHLLENLQSAQNFEQVKEAWGEYGITVTDEFAKSLVGIGNENIASALMLLGSGLDEATISALDNTHLSENLDKFMTENGLTIEEAVASLLLASGHDLEEVSAMLGKDAGYLLAMTLPEGMVKGIKDGETTVKQASEEFKEMATMSDQDAKDAEESAQKVGEGTTAGVETELTNGKDGIGTATEAVTKTIDDKIKELPESEQANAKKMMEMMVEGILQGDPLVQSAIEKSAQAVIDKVEKVLARGEGRRIVNNFLLGMSDSIDANFASMIENNLASYAGLSINAVDARINFDNGYTIVMNLLRGMEQGINGGEGQFVVDLFGTFCNAILETLYNYFGIHSPSRVFNQIGQYMMEGLEIGIEDSGVDAISAIADVSKAIVEESNGMSLDNSIDTSVNGLDVVATKLERVAEIFSGIADTIARMGGLELPNIATGRSIPYRAQIGTSSGAGGGIADAESIEEAIYSAFSRALNSDDTDQKINITLMIDGRKMADIVSKYQRQQKRAWGV